MNPVRPQPSWPLSALLLTALALAGCGDTITHESKIRVDVSACLVPSAAGGGGAACGSALQQQAQAGLTACLAYRIGTMDQAALPLVLTEGTLRPTRAEAFEVAGATRVAMRLFLLKPGNDATACAGYTLETACRPADATSPASCLLAFRAESTAVSGDGRVDIVYGSGEVPCGIECNDLCQPNDSTCQKLCWGAGEPLVELCNGADDDCDGEVDEGFGVGEACTGAGECGAGLRECACHATAGCDPADLTDARWTQALCTTAPGDPLAGARAEKCNGLDDDCDGETDEDLTRDCSTACGPGSQTCAAGVWSACPAVQPVPETCNDVDDDCDGQTDEEDATDCTLFFRDEDEDEAGVDGDARCLCKAATPYTATVEGDCDDADPARHPEADETCNGLDDDCDDALGPGEVDEDEDGLLDCLGDCIDDASQLVKAGACVGDADCLQVEDCAEDLSGPCTCRLPAADPLP